MPGSELSELVRELRARAETSGEADWLCAKPAAPAPPAGLPISPAVAAAAPAAPAAKPAAALTLDREAPRTPGAVDAELASLRAQVEACRQCPLGSQRLNPADDAQ